MFFLLRRNLRALELFRKLAGYCRVYDVFLEIRQFIDIYLRLLSLRKQTIKHDTKQNGL